MRSFLIGLLACLAAGGAWAGDQLTTGAPPAWVRPVEETAPTDSVGDDGSAVRMALVDQQYRFDGGIWTQYVRTRRVVQSPQALSLLGSLVIPWNPAHQTITVHAVNIVRGDQTIDALQGHEFTILRREANLESAMLDGVLTGTLQLDDLRVGDILDVAYSSETRIRVLGDHAEMLTSANLPGLVERYRLRASWPTAQHMRLRASDGWDAPAVRRRGADSEIEIDLQRLEPILAPADAPTRFHQLRQLEITDYGAWSDIADVFVPLYDRASTLEPDSPLKARIAEIQAASSDPAVQTAAALRLVQDEVRYLALAMGEGGLSPASADETWRRRLGDCKGKTALLLALLRELGVPARAVLVSTGDDALDQRLPLVSVFDHIMVEAQVEGRPVWLDGTRSGDRRLADLPIPPYGWVLPVARDAAIVHIEQSPAATPTREFDIAFDASGGLFAPVPMTGVMLERGDDATLMQQQFALAPAAQRDAYMRQTWASLFDDLEIAEVRSGYDREANEFRMTVSGKVKLDWVSAGSRRLEIPLSRVSWSVGEPREDGPYKNLPWTIDFPNFFRFRTAVTLPPGGGFILAGEDIDTQAAGYAHVRRTRMDGDVVVMERESRSLTPEMTEAERAAAVEPLRLLGRKRAEIVAASDYAMTGADEDALSSDAPRTTAEMIARGLALNSSGRADEAIAAFDAAITRDPTSANAYANRGIVRFWKGDAAGAKADFDAAADIDPTEWVAMNGRGLLAMRENRFQDAVDHFSDVLTRSEDEPFALRMRAGAYSSLKDYDRALTDLHRLQAADPSDVQSHLLEIGVLTAAERLPEAMAAANALAARDPRNVQALQVQASVREKSGAYAEAKAALDAALAIEADHPLLRLDRADVRAKQGDFEGAREDMAAARPSAEGSAGLLNNMCWLRAVSGFDLNEALTDCDAALSLSPDAPAMLDSRAFVLLQLDRADEALASYDAALAKAPEQFASRYGRGLTLRALGRDAEAQAEIDAALAANARAGDEFKAYEARLARP